MKTGKLKCPKCSYIFEADTEKNNGTCPLCMNEYEVEKALDLLKEYEEDNQLPTPITKSKGKIITEWIVFFCSFTIFIFVLYYIISYILGA